jgi:hypothetical protein
MIGLQILREFQMAKVKYISSPAEIPADQNFVLIAAGYENGNARHPRGLTITIAQNPESERAFLAAIETGKATAEAEGIPTVFVCKQPPR